jgi:hypothetical protein
MVGVPIEVSGTDEALVEAKRVELEGALAALEERARTYVAQAFRPADPAAK